MLFSTQSMWAKEIIYHGLRTLALDQRLTFIDLGPLLIPGNDDDKAWREALIRSVTDPELKNFWARYDSEKPEAQKNFTRPVMDRIWQLNARPEIRNIIGQSTSSFQMADVVAGNKILLVNLSGLGKDTASLAGTLFMNSLWHAVKTVRGNKPNYLYLDEFQDFMRLPVDPEDMLAKARGFGLGMTLAHQHLGQLPNEMKAAVLANARSKVVFQTNNADAQIMAREFGSQLTADDFIHLGKYEAVARVVTGDGVSQPFTLATNEPAKGYGRTAQVKAVSRDAHGRSAGEVEHDIIERRHAPSVPNVKKRPPLSGEGWA
jgi:hypothetical protein